MVQVDIGSILDQARLSSAGITQAIDVAHCRHRIPQLFELDGRLRFVQPPNQSPVVTTANGHLRRHNEGRLAIPPHPS